MSKKKIDFPSRAARRDYLLKQKLENENNNKETLEEVKVALAEAEKAAKEAREAADEAVAIVTDGGGSLDPEAGKFPIADADATIKQSWIKDLEFELNSLKILVNKALYGDNPYPVLDLQFQGSKYLDPRATFTRSTPDWDWNGKRYEANDPVLSDEGLWLWPSRTNLLTHSWDFSNSAWQKSVGATAENKDGYFTLSHGGAGTWYTIRTTITESSGVVFSTEVRAFVGFRIRVGTADLHTVYFDENMSVVSKGSSVTSVKVVPRGAFSRIELAFDAVPQGFVTFSPVDYNYAGAVLDIKYAQLETGDVATPHIPTDGAQVTVGSSTLEVKGDAFRAVFNPHEGALVWGVGENDLGIVTGKIPYANCGLLGNGASSASDGGLYFTHQHVILRDSNGDWVLTSSLPLPKLPLQKNQFRVAFSYKSDKVTCSHKGDVNSAEADTKDFLYNSASRIYVHPMTRGYVRSLSYYDRALSYEQLQELTK